MCSLQASGTVRAQAKNIHLMVEWFILVHLVCIYSYTHPIVMTISYDMNYFPETLMNRGHSGGETML